VPLLPPMHRIARTADGSRVSAESQLTKLPAGVRTSFQLAPCDTAQCVLIAMAVGRGPRAVALRDSLREVCEGHSWIRVVLNFFDRAVAASDTTGYPQCVGTTAVPGFKTLFWKLVLTPRAVAGYSHVFLMDSDLDVAGFEFGKFVHIANVTNTSVLSPSHIGNATSSLYGGGMLARRCEHSSCRRCDMDPANSCAVCRQPVVEVKSPMFTAMAWRVLHDEVLRHAPSELLIGEGLMDLLWCGLISHKLHGCEFPWMKKGNTSTRTPDCLGDACAYSYVTPIRDMNDKSIMATRDAIEASGTKPAHGALRRSAIRKRDPFLPMPFDNMPLTDWVQTFGDPKPLWGFKMFPSWRAPNTKLAKQPCWTAEQLGLGPYPRVPSPRSNPSARRRSPLRRTPQPVRPQPVRVRPSPRNISVSRLAWSRGSPGTARGVAHTRHFSVPPSRNDRGATD